jgi:hypothetical protein
VDFFGLKIKVADWLNRSDLNGLIPELIQLTQRDLERKNWRFMEKRETFSSSETYRDFPVRLKNVKVFWLIDDDRRYKLIQRNEKEAIAEYPYLTTNKSKPKLFSPLWDSSKFLFRPTPDKSYDYDLLYRQYSAELQNDTDTNWWTTNAWETLLFGALLQAEPYLERDGRIMLWKAFYDSTVLKLERDHLSEELHNSSPFIKMVEF